MSLAEKITLIFEPALQSALQTFSSCARLEALRDEVLAAIAAHEKPSHRGTCTVCGRTREECDAELHAIKGDLH